MGLALTALSVACATALLSGCATTPAPTPIAAQPAPRPYVAPPGLERVMGKTPAAVIALLGSPRLDRTEGKTRQLQYSGKACVLDLYAVGPVVTYAEARKPTGLPNDPVTCLNLIAPH
jgi:hypothetical protein